MKSKQLISILAFSSLAFGLSLSNPLLPSKVQAEPSPQTTTNNQVQLLFVQNSLGGSYDGQRITLNGVGATIFFSDRPERVAGKVLTSEFISHWDKGSDNFQSNPPNATLSILTDQGVNSVVVELTEPRLEKQTLSYKVKVLQGKLPTSFDEASLFIDILGRWRMYSAGVAAGAAAAGGGYYYHPPVVVPVAPVVVPPVYIAPRPIIVY
jgi:hypothetical protein